jgi:hypothetical protein
MWYEQAVPSDEERMQWEWEPLRRVGPLRFGQNVYEVAEALGEPFNGWPSGKQWAPFSGAGVDTYYREGTMTLAAIAIDPFDGPQVSYEGVSLVAQLPSALTSWIEGTAETLEGEEVPHGLRGLHFGSNGEVGLPALGLVMRCLQNGDHVRTRPVFVASEWAMSCMDHDLGNIPAREWGIY